jgi:hypothetical protein
MFSKLKAKLRGDSSSGFSGIDLDREDSLEQLM